MEAEVVDQKLMLWALKESVEMVHKKHNIYIVQLRVKNSDKNNF